MTGPISMVIVTVGWLAGWWLLWRLPGLDRGAGSAALRDLAVIVPARNEARTLPVLLADLAAQRPAPAEVVVVDDGSDDGTAAVARTAGFRVVRTSGPPAGWAGKPWACWTGVEVTDAATLVFLDADVRLAAPDTLARLVATQQHTGGLLSVQPLHVTGRPVEGLSFAANLVALAGSGAFTPRQAAPTVAFGPCLVCQRRQYLAVGGHAAVRREVAEDAALASRFRQARLPVTLRAGRDALSFRMYPRGLRPLVEGWSKNLAAGAGAAPLTATLLVIAWVASLLASVGLVAGLATGGPISHGPISHGAPAIAAAAAIYAAVVTQLAWMGRRVGRFGWWPVVAYPLSVAAFVGLFAWSVVRTHVLGSVTWRGRRIAVGRQRA
jgi:4,4'-diaponeurosporenoate glycosyltransferase